MPGLGHTSSDERFTLRSADGEFNSRTNDVFGSLNSIETQHTAYERTRSEDESRRSRSRSPDESDASERGHFRSQRQGDLRRRIGPRAQVDSRHTELNTFRRPSSRPPRRPNVPDFRRNPQNYTRYDLSSVADHTEQSNTSAALSFLDDLRKRRESGEGSERKKQTDYETRTPSAPVWDTSSKYVRRKHTYNRPNKTSSDASVEPQPSTSSYLEQEESKVDLKENEKAKFVGGKLTMPEYVVGQETVHKKERKEVSLEGMHCNALTLDHLNDEDTVKDNEANPVQTQGGLEMPDGPSEKEVQKVQFKKFKRKTNTCTKKREDPKDE